jgi:uncharacterized protein
MESHTVLFWLAATLAAIFVGGSKGGLPMVGVLATPMLALVLPPVMAAGLLLPVYIVTDMFGLYAYRHHFSARLLKILIPATTLGVILGWATASLVSERLVTGLVGVIGVVFTLNLLLRKPPEGPGKVANVAPGLFWGTIAGFTSFVSHTGGPPYQVYVLPQKLDKAVFAGTTTILFAYVNAIKLIPYYALGQLNVANLKVAAVLMIPGILAVLAGVKIVKVLPQELFFKLVTWALFLISLKLIYDGFIA